MIPLRDNIPTDRFPVVTLAIIVINVFVFLFLQGPSFSFSAATASRRSRWSSTARSPTGSRIPGKECDLRADHGGAPTSPESGGTLRLRGDARVPRRRKQRAVPVEDLQQPPAFLTIFTSMFMHGGWLHITFNMLFLWVFGNNIEDSMGRFRFVFFYLLGGIAAALAQVAVGPTRPCPWWGRAARSRRCWAATRCFIRAPGC